MMYTDGSWCAVRAGTMAILIYPDRQSVSQVARLDFPTINNASKYEALLLGLYRA